MEKEIVVKMKINSHSEVVLTNNNGDRFYFNPLTRNGEELMDFLS